MIFAWCPPENSALLGGASTGDEGGNTTDTGGNREGAARGNLTRRGRRRLFASRPDGREDSPDMHKGEA